MFGRAKKWLDAPLGSAATSGVAAQNRLCAYLPAAVLVGLLANTAFGWWRLDPVVGLGIAGLGCAGSSNPGVARTAADRVDRRQQQPPASSVCVSVTSAGQRELVAVEVEVLSREVIDVGQGHLVAEERIPPGGEPHGSRQVGVRLGVQASV